MLHVERIPFFTCWLWTAAIDRYGYGQFQFEGSMKGAHRVSWRLFRGCIPAGMLVCHKCDITCCVNPEHLFTGTQVDNINDALLKGRLFSGVKHR